MTQIIFQEGLKKKLGDKLSQYLFLSVCNTLSLDFALRKGSVDIEQHVANCAENICNYILEKKVLKDDFNEVLSIFGAAIANKSKTQNLANKTKEQKVESNKEQEAVTKSIEGIISNCPNLCKLQQDDKDTIKAMLANLQKLDQEVDINVLSQNTNILAQSVKEVAAVKKTQEKTQEDILQFLRLHKQYRINTQASKNMTRSFK